MPQNAAQLIARVSVQGMDKLSSDLLTARNLFDGLGNVVRTVMRDLELAAVAGIGAFAAFTVSAVKEAAKVERSTLAFAALHDSMKLARQEMGFLREYATHSVNTFDDLTAAALRLDATGINPNRFIKLIDQASLLSGMGPQFLTQAMDALGRIGSGANMGMAIRMFSRLGIGYNALRSEGVEVSGRNQIKSSPEVVLGAIERLLQRKVATFGEYFESSISIKFSNLKDAWLRLLDAFGQAWFPLITSILNTLTPFINFLASSGEISKIGAAFASLFGGMKDGGWVRMLMFGIAVLEGVPDVIRSVWDYTKGFMTGFGKILIGIVDIIIEGVSRIGQALHELAPIIQRIGDAAMAIGGSFSRGSGNSPIMGGAPIGQAHGLIDDLYNWIRGRWGVEANRRSRIGALGEEGSRVPAAFGGGSSRMSEFEKLLGSLPRFGDYSLRFSKRTDELMAQFDRYMKTPTAAVNDPFGGGMFNKNHIADELAAEKQTAENTARVAASMDHFKRYALGGGDRGKTGVTVAEMYGGARGGSVRIDSGRARDMLERAVLEMIGEAHTSMRRSGLGGN